jgi:hypothetical protein
MVFYRALPGQGGRYSFSFFGCCLGFACGMKIIILTGINNFGESYGN